MNTPLRRAASTDFHVDVPGVGHFRFGYRKLADEMEIAVEYSLITKGIDTPTEWLGIMAGAVSQLKVLTVEAPDGWDIDDMDPLDDNTYFKLMSVHQALKEKEYSFRQGKVKAGQANGAGAGEGAGVLVPAQVQPTTD